LNRKVDSWEMKCILYEKKFNRDAMIFEIILNAVKLLRETHLIKNSRKLLDMNHNYSGFLKNMFMDKIKIMIATENILKALLLTKGYVVHRIKKHPKLNPRKIPLRLGDLKKVFRPTIVDSKWTYTEVEHLTLSPTEIYEVYGDILRLGPKLKGILVRYSSDRNNMHLFAGQGVSVSNIMYFELELLIKYVNKYALRLARKYAKKRNIKIERIKKAIKPIHI
jgi:hypothetical protein